MTKSDFIFELYEKLPNVSEKEIDERLAFYIEMIDDRIEEGMNEDDAVAAVGSVDDIAAQIISEIPISKIVKEKIKNNRKMKPWEIVLLVLGSPVWVTLLISVFAVVLSIYISIWSVIISLWSVFISLVACALSGIVAGILLLVYSNVASGFAMIAAGFVCAGFSIFSFYGCLWITKSVLLLTKKFFVWIKNSMMKKEDA